MEKISRLVEEFLVGARETNKKVGPLLSNALETMDSIQNIVDESRGPLNKTLTALDDVPDILAQLKRTLRRFNNFVSSEEQDIEVSTENIRLITGNLRELTENAKRYPSQLMFGEPPPRSEPGGKQ